MLRHARAALDESSKFAPLSGAAKQVVVRGLRAAVNTSLDTFFGVVETAIANLAGETADFLDDIRAIEPGENLTEQITGLFLERIEDAVRAHFDDENPGFDLAFRARGSYDPPDIRVSGFTIVTPPLSIDLHLDLGRVETPLDELVSTVRQAVASLAFVEDLARALATKMVEIVQAQFAKEAAEVEQALATQARDGASARLDASVVGRVDLSIVQPTPDVVYGDYVDMEVVVHGIGASFLGLDSDEFQRVFMWLNEVPLSMDRLTVSPHVTTNTSESSKVAEGVPTRSRSARQAATRRTATPPGWQTSPGLIKQRGSKRREHHDRREQVPMRRRPAKRIRASRLAAVPDGILLRLRVSAETLDEGINTLVVAVIDGREHRVQQSVAFVVVAPDAVPTDRAIYMPDRPTWKLEKLPASLRTSWTDLKDRLPGAPPRGEPKRRKGEFWLPEAKERKNRRRRAAVAQRRSLDAALKGMRTLRKSVDGGALRPTDDHSRRNSERPSPRDPLGERGR